MKKIMVSGELNAKLSAEQDGANRYKINIAYRAGDTNFWTDKESIIKFAKAIIAEVGNDGFNTK